MTELRCIRCGALNIGQDQICKVCEFEVNPASQLPPGSLVFAGPQTNTRAYGATGTTVDSIGPFNGITDILGPTIRLFVENFWLITKIVLVIVFPFQLLATFSTKDLINNPEPTIGLFFLDRLCQILIAPALIYSLLQVMQTGTAPGVNEAYRWGFDKIGKVAICAATSWLLQALGTMMCFVPGIIIAVMFILVGPLAVLEKSSVSEVLLDSKELTKGHRWNIFGAVLIIWLLSTFFSWPAQDAAKYLMDMNFNFWPLVLVTSILCDIIDQATTILSLVTYLSIRALSSQRTQ